MRRDPVLDAFDTEAESLSAAMLDLEADAWARPTVCEPWTVRELLGHVTVVIDWLPGMLAGDAPPQATVSAVDYYRRDARFSPETNSRRIDLARERAARATDGPDLARQFDTTWRTASALCAREPADRVVRTRHGDPMLLRDFLTTRLVEVAIHGLDLATATTRPPWLTAPAGRLLTELLLGPHGLDKAARLGWDPTTFLRKATGRSPLTPTEAANADNAGIHWLSLG